MEIIPIGEPGHLDSAHSEAGVGRPMRPEPHSAPDTVPHQPAEEVDVWWGGFAGRALVPSFHVCALLTILIIAGALYLGGWPGTPFVRASARLAIALIWLLQLGRWGYRMVAINYRLTTRRLFLNRGFRHPGQPGVELSRIRQVVVVRGMWERWLGVGRVRVILGEKESPVVLEGVRDPDYVALEIRKQVKHAQLEA
jgi:membrane protein YdbS with pleckstrin-like domain